jgi:uncharacterized protein (DUF433 family)
MSSTTNGRLAAASTNTDKSTNASADEPTPAPPSFLPPEGLGPRELDAWRQSLHDYYSAVDPLARFLLDRLIDAACFLTGLMKSAPDPSRDDAAWARRLRLAETSFTRAMTDWHRHTRHLQQITRAAQTAESKAAHKPKRATDEPAEPPPPPPRNAFDKTDDIEIDTATPINWEDHIVFEPKIDHRWPVIRGTTHRADGIAAMIDYGWSYRYILEHFQGITLEDLRAVIAADAVQMCGPWPEGQRPEPQPRAVESTDAPPPQTAAA